MSNTAKPATKKFNGRIENTKWEVCPNRDVHNLFDFLMEEEHNGYPVTSGPLLRYIEVYKEFREFFVSIGSCGLNLAPRCRRMLALEAENYAHGLSGMIKSDLLRKAAEFRGFVFED